MRVRQGTPPGQPSFFSSSLKAFPRPYKLASSCASKSSPLYLQQLILPSGYLDQAPLSQLPTKSCLQLGLSLVQSSTPAENIKHPCTPKSSPLAFWPYLLLSLLRLYLTDYHL
ncbi:hypothetical protein CPB86DRAFT_172941 [Serendipita vermifera]|nr:hypothetical protein CPB86DRAFT_172941 [Serendipita vermifera]